MKLCPTCAKPVIRVRNSGGWMNDDQFDSVKAGDWYCPTCPDNDRGKSGLCYWWDSEVIDPVEEVQDHGGY